MGKWTINSSLISWEKTDQKIEEELHQCNFSEKFINSLMLAIDEIFANISMYAYKGDEGEVIIETKYNVCDIIKTAQVTFSDFGERFNPLEKELNTDIHESNSTKRKIGGLGIYLAKKQADEMKYEYSSNMNKLTIIKSEGN